MHYGAGSWYANMYNGTLLWYALTLSFCTMRLWALQQMGQSSNGQGKGWWKKQSHSFWPNHYGQTGGRTRPLIEIRGSIERREAKREKQWMIKMNRENAGWGRKWDTLEREMESRRDEGWNGEMERWRDGEMERWRAGETERWSAEEQEGWRDREIVRLWDCEI